MKKILTILIFLISVVAIGQNKQKVYLHLNGYKGNLSYRTGYPLFSTYNYFYVHNPQGDTSVYIESNGDDYFIEDGAYVGNSAMYFHKANGHFTYTGPKGAVVLTEVKEGDQFVPVLSLQTTTVKIKTKGLYSPFLFTAYALVDGHAWGDGKNYMSKNQRVKLIKGLVYGVDNGCFNVIYIQDSLLVIHLHDGLMDESDTTYTAFYFIVNPDGTVLSYNQRAATNKRNTLRFNTVKVSINPELITNGNTNKVRLPYGNDAFHYITKPTKIKVFRDLANMVFWIPLNTKILRTYLYREM